MKRRILFLLFGIYVVLGSFVYAENTTMASYDFDGDYIDEIIRSSEENNQTVFRVYKRIKDSYFVKPAARFDVPGRLVQVPEIADVNSDGKNEYFFATGSDMGIIYYDVATGTFTRNSTFTMKDTEAVPEKKNDVSFEEEAKQAADFEYAHVTEGSNATSL